MQLEYLFLPLFLYLFNEDESLANMVKNNNKNTFFFKTKNCSNDDPFISCNDRIGKMLHNICISAVAISLR